GIGNLGFGNSGNNNIGLFNSGNNNIGFFNSGDIAGVRQRASAGISANGASNIPRQRGHHTRCRSRTFQPVPHWEHTWITRPA
ncbi:hypothetical protein BVW01_04300, partial [Mycobacterium tuberculosis]